VGRVRKGSKRKGKKNKGEGIGMNKVERGWCDLETVASWWSGEVDALLRCQNKRHIQQQTTTTSTTTTLVQEEDRSNNADDEKRL